MVRCRRSGRREDRGPGRRPAIVALALALLLPSIARADFCPGDCDGDQRIGIDDLITSVTITIGEEEAFACPAADADASGSVEVGDVVIAVQSALRGCENFQVPGSPAVEASTRAALTSMGSLTVLNFGTAGTGGGGGASAENWYLVRPALRGLGAAGGDGGGSGVTACSGGGTQDVESVVDATSCRRTTRFRQCRELNANGATVRDGTLVQTLDDPMFCQDLDPSRATLIQLDFDAFTQTELNPNGAVINRRTMTARSIRLPSLQQGCAGPDMGEGRETLEGLLHFECNPQLDDDCTPGITDLVLRMRRLQIERGSSGSPCTLSMAVNGGLAQENRELGDEFSTDFRAFVLTEQRLSDGSSLVTHAGFFSLDCAGAVFVASDPRRPLRLFPGAACPSDGELRVGLGVGLPLATPLEKSDRRASGGGSAEMGGFVDSTFRAADGTVYQVLQNPRGNPVNFTEDIRVTSVVGSTDAAASCNSGAGDQFDVQAVVAAAPGQAVSKDFIVTSEIIGDGSPPCFNPNAENGVGAVCIGVACSADCRCPSGGCQVFSARNGLAPGEARTIPELTLVSPIAPFGGPCGNFAAQETYGFGAAQPSVDLDLCSPVPADGFTLASDSSLVLAYDVPFGQPFDAGSAGFAIDRDGDSPRCFEDANQVIDGLSNRNQLPPPLVRFGATQFVQFDFNGDDVIDKVASNCADIPPVRCGGATPTPTPTVGIPPLCPERDLLTSQQASTRGQPNLRGGASCGDGGNESPERAYGFRATSNGVYVFDTLSLSGLTEPFDTLLYARRGRDCDRGAELACNDNVGGGAKGSQVIVPLQSGDEITITVDGVGGESGDFNLRVQRFDTAPTATPTPTRTVGPGPDLVVTSVTAAGPATAGGTVAVTAMVRNAGELVAGESNVRFVFATNAQLSSGRVDSGAGCILPALGPGAAAPCMLDVLVPGNLTTGNYFVGAVADFEDGVVEVNENNNEAATAQPIFIQGLDPTPTPTVTPTRVPGGCGRTREGCSGTCPVGFCTDLGSTFCRCLSIILPTATPTATPDRCGLKNGQCQGACGPGQVCFSFPSCRCIRLGF